jgi:HAD superfamily hydrolase (TIGR01509 family)
MDGVIVDSNDTHTLAWKLYLRGHGVDIPDIETRMLGKRNDEIVRDFFSHLDLSDLDIHSHGAQKEALYREIIAPELSRKIVPGIAGFLSRHRELPIGLATNAEPANVDFVLNGAGIRQYFRAVVNGHDVKRPKPFPDIYLKVAEQLDIAPEHCVVFEDSLTGVQAARAAGMRVVGLTTTLREIPDVDFTVGSFLDPELEVWLQSVATAA